MFQFIFSILLLFASFNIEENSFEGSINIVKKNPYSTLFYTYRVKGSNVRVDEYDISKKLLKSLLINIEDESIVVLNVHNKEYVNIEIKSIDYNLENYFVIKTENHRVVNGYKCYQWRVKNRKKNTEIAFWVINNDFYFYRELVSLLNRTNKDFEFFSRIYETEGFFPMLTVERTLLRKEKKRTEVLRIKNEKINKSVFEIPAGYEKIQLSR